MRVYFDSSAFAKRYISEEGTGAVLEWCDRATEIGLPGIALPEIISAFCRLHHEARITGTQYRQLKSLLLADIEDCRLRPDSGGIGPSGIESRNQCAARHGRHTHRQRRGTADVSVTADTRQREAAARAGLRVETV